MRLQNLLLILFACAVAGPALGGPFEDAIVAYRTGDYATTLRLLRPLAEQGHASAQYDLGLMYDIGQGLPQDYAAAMSWYRKAAEQGHASAQYNLGLNYFKGHGVPQDYVQAYLWLNLAASCYLTDAASRDRAINARDLVAANMTPAQIAEAGARVEAYA